jgi:hypothetical protein
MLIGQTMFIPASGAPGVAYYGAWGPRQGDAATALVELIRASAASGWSLRFLVETKDSEESDAEATSLGSLTMSSVSTGSLNVTGCKELVRLKFEGTGGGTDRWLHLRTNPFLWQPN